MNMTMSLFMNMVMFMNNELMNMGMGMNMVMFMNNKRYGSLRRVAVSTHLFRGGQPADVAPRRGRGQDADVGAAVACVGRAVAAPAGGARPGLPLEARAGRGGPGVHLSRRRDGGSDLRIIERRECTCVWGG